MISKQGSGDAGTTITHQSNLVSPRVNMNPPLVSCPVCIQSLRHRLIPQEEITAATVIWVLADSIVLCTPPLPSLLEPVIAIIVDVQGAQVPVLLSLSLMNRWMTSAIAHAHLFKAIAHCCVG